MDELIKITTNETGEQLVSARELHEFLEISKHITQWIKPYIAEHNDYGFDENVDFTRIDAEVNPTNGIPVIDYAISLDMAKELSMISKTEKGKKARKYFIKCEKALKEQNKPTCIEDVLISSLQEMKALKGEVQAIKKASEEAKEEIQGIRDVVAINSADWKNDCKALVVKIATKLGGFNHIQDVYKEIYSTLEKRLGVQLNIRLTNKRRRMADEGVCKSKRDKLNYISVISDDKKLIEGYVAITKEIAIKYGVA